MKALLTGGGRGTRLRPITYTSNKHLIPIANKPMILYALEYVRDAGITEIGLNYNDTKDEFEALLGNGENYGVHITYIHQPAPIGLANIIAVSREFLGDDPFIFYLSDNILAGGITEFVQAFEKNQPDAQLLLAEVPDPERFGVPEIKDGRVISVEEKPQIPKSNFAITGVYMYNKNIWGAIEGPDAIKPSPRGEYEISDAHQWLLDHNFRVEAINVTGWWKDTGKPDDLLAANRLILEKHYEFTVAGEVDNTSQLHGNVHVPKSAKIVNSTIHGPVTLGENTHIIDSTIGPFTSINGNCHIEKSVIENSIVFSSSTIKDVSQRISSSLIGKNVVIAKSEMPPQSMQVILGDNSHVALS